MICIIRAVTEIITKALATDATDDMKSVTFLTASAGHRAKIFWKIRTPNTLPLPDGDFFRVRMKRRGNRRRMQRGLRPPQEPIRDL
jgi:hypothetical protein